MPDILEILQFPPIQNALLAGICIAIVAALIGYFLIMRGLTFAGHALPNIGFAGAAGAVLIGVDPLFGLFAFTVGAGVGIALLGKETRDRDITIGVLMTLALGLGLASFALYSGNAERVYAFLFGNIIGISQLDIVISAIASAFTLLGLLIIGRPLLFSSIDPDVAQARGVPVTLLSVLFMVLTAITISVAIQVVGALLVFVLLVGPAATAMRLTQSPIRALVISVILGVIYTVLGILLAAMSLTWPVSFFIATISFVVYLAVRLLSQRRDHRADRSQLPDEPATNQEIKTQAVEPLRGIAR